LCLRVEKCRYAVKINPVLIAFTDLEGNARVAVTFQTGLLVRHRLYGYRGVVVTHDPYCMAGDTWYKANKTQPSKEQPWYHVLVHESGGLSTYVAQSNLVQDESGKPIEHPRLRCYFADFKDGRYCLKEK
jgi:heat shock protein HspQ